jgi:hypothetical protein
VADREHRVNKHANDDAEILAPIPQEAEEGKVALGAFTLPASTNVSTLLFGRKCLSAKWWRLASR